MSLCAEVIAVYPDKVKINLEYYYHHSLIGDIKLIIQPVCG